MMAVNALTPGDVVRESREPTKPVLTIQGISASVFQTEPFAKDKKRVSPFTNESKEKNFLSSSADESTLSENAAKEWAGDVPGLPNLTTIETFRRDSSTVLILGPVIKGIPLNASSNKSMGVIEWLNQPGIVNKNGV